MTVQRCLVTAAVAVMARGVFAGVLPDDEWAMIRVIARRNGLSAEGTRLLAAIRKVENGRPGLEFGVGGPLTNGHPAHKYRDGVSSFYLQGDWAAGTIRKRYTGDLDAFARRYCARNAAGWAKSVRRVMANLADEAAGRPYIPWPSRNPARTVFPAARPRRLLFPPPGVHWARIEIAEADRGEVGG